MYICPILIQSVRFVDIILCAWHTFGCTKGTIMIKILAIDDSKEHLEIVEDIFISEGYKIVCCQDAYKALTLLEDAKFDCIISDLKMPVIEGTHLLNIAREKYPQTPVIILSAYVVDEAELLEKGAYAVLRKPPSIQTLISTVENAISDSASSIAFVFNHTNLKDITNKITSRLILVALKKSKGNQLKAAKLLGISRQSLIRYIKKYNLRHQTI